MIRATFSVVGWPFRVATNAVRRMLTSCGVKSAGLIADRPVWWLTGLLCGLTIAWGTGWRPL